jgi:hypothetical protein
LAASQAQDHLKREPFRVKYAQTQSERGLLVAEKAKGGGFESKNGDDNK